VLRFENFPSKSLSQRYVILDRDGTIIVERNYLSDSDQVELLPGVGAGLARLRAAGFGLVVVTNQSGIGRGYFDLDQLARIHGRMQNLLAAEGAKIDGIYFCPHRPDENCICRKPATELIRRASSELNFNPTESFVIGDNVCDIQLGQRIGATTILVRSGYGAKIEEQIEVLPDYVSDDVASASLIITKLNQQENSVQRISL
jgi:D-glycero-D-manno-heptose 1,7-bisphosphate phosphatase